MKTRLSPIFVVLLLSMVPFCHGQGGTSGMNPQGGVAADVAAIKALLSEFVRLYNAEDFDRLISVFYAKGAVLMSPDASPRRTGDEILRSYRQYAEAAVEHIETSVAEDVRVCEDTAYAWGMDTGTTTPKASGVPVPYSLKWLMVFERQPDGGWKCLYEIWNENGPA